MKKFILFFLSIALGISSALSSDPTFAATPPSSMTLEQIQELALSRSPILRSKLKEIEGEKQKSLDAGLLPNPSLLVQLGSLASAGVNGSTVDLTLSQVLPFPGKRTRLAKSYDLKAQIASASESEARLAIQHAVTLAVVRLSSLNELAKHTSERQKRYRLIQQFFQTHPQVSPTQRIESALIENQIRMLEKGMFNLEHERKNAQFDLNYYLDLDPLPEIPFEWLQEVKLPDRKMLTELIFEKNPEWISRKRRLEWTENELHRAEWGWLPDFNLGLNYRIERVQPQNLFFSGLLGVSLPLWDRGQYSTSAARAQLDSEESLTLALRQKLEKDLNQIWSKLETLSKMVKRFPIELIPLSERKFEEAEKEFRRGRITSSLFLATDSQMHETMDAVYESQAQFIEALSQLELLAGRKLQLK